MLRKLNGSKEALSKDNKSMNAFKKKLDLGMYYAIEFFYPLSNSWYIWQNLGLWCSMRLWYIQFYQQILLNFLKRRYNVSLCKTESVNFPILILRNNFCKNFFFCFGIFFVLYTYLAGEFQKSSTALEQQGTLLHWRRLFTRYHSRFFVQVGHETTYAAIGNKHFFTKT